MPNLIAKLGLALLTGVLVATSAAADIYRFVDRDGVVHLADHPAGPGWKLILRGKGKASPRRGKVAYRELQRNRARFGPIIERIAGEFRLDAKLVHAVVQAESAYDPKAVSSKGAVGLMQLMPGTAQRYGVTDRYNPSHNVYAGVRYLRDLLVQFQDVVLALAAYNAGENAVVKHGLQIPPYPETREYVKRVLANYRELRGKS
ncbi:MAG: lytic transglycosylase domain-containing protein [Ectothiorhodospiraceae bacterium]|nr:lytic transglycosylase domain-containing protein [Chromatiales bacterium]MCP5156940.1 lytic transglycosylase domain-containing protein [Ectothiorhodospiraceae bacterium]